MSHNHFSPIFCNNYFIFCDLVMDFAVKKTSRTVRNCAGRAGARAPRRRHDRGCHRGELARIHPARPTRALAVALGCPAFTVGQAAAGASCCFRPLRARLAAPGAPAPGRPAGGARRLDVRRHCSISRCCRRRRCSSGCSPAEARRSNANRDRAHVAAAAVVGRGGGGSAGPRSAQATARSGCTTRCWACVALEPCGPGSGRACGGQQRAQPPVGELRLLYRISVGRWQYAVCPVVRPAHGCSTEGARAGGGGDGSVGRPECGGGAGVGAAARGEAASGAQLARAPVSNRQT